MTESGSGRLAAIAARMGRVLSALPPLGEAVRFDLGTDGEIFVDARRQPPLVTAGSGPAACTLSMRLDTLERVLGGDLDGAAAFRQGEMTISGDVALAARLNELLAATLAGKAAGGGG